MPDDQTIVFESNALYSALRNGSEKNTVHWGTLSSIFTQCIANHVLREPPNRSSSSQ